MIPDTTKIVVTGKSAGGAGTWRMLNSYPQLFAAAIPICGMYSSFGDIKHIPVWVHHGSLDNAVPVSQSQHYISDFEETGLIAFYTEDSTDIQLSNAITNNVRLLYSEYEEAKRKWLRQPPICFKTSPPDDIQPEHRSLQVRRVDKWGCRHVLDHIRFTRLDE